MSENGDEPAAQAPSVFEPMSVPPVGILLDGCRVSVARDPSGMRLLRFEHVSGVLAFTAALDEVQVGELVRMLTGGIYLPS